MAQIPWLRGRSGLAVALFSLLVVVLIGSSLRPDDWPIWYDLGIASTGSQRQRAPVRAATLNPLEDDIGALRERGYRLPAGRATR